MRASGSSRRACSTSSARDVADPAGRATAVTPGHPPGARSACPACGSTDGDRVRRTAQATRGSIAILAEGLPVDRCVCGFRRVTGTFADAASAACSTSIPVARGRRVRPDACLGCGASMSMPVRRSVRAVTVTPEVGPVTTLRLDLPMQRCPDCGLDHLPARGQADLTAALAAVIDAGVEAAGPTD